jgi:hypothetical protein
VDPIGLHPPLYQLKKNYPLENTTDDNISVAVRKKMTIRQKCDDSDAEEN